MRLIFFRDFGHKILEFCTFLLGFSPYGFITCVGLSMAIIGYAYTSKFEHWKKNVTFNSHLPYGAKIRKLFQSSQLGCKKLRVHFCPSFPLLPFLYSISDIGEGSSALLVKSTHFAPSVLYNLEADFKSLWLYAKKHQLNRFHKTSSYGLLECIQNVKCSPLWESK